MQHETSVNNFARRSEHTASSTTRRTACSFAEALTTFFQCLVEHPVVQHLVRQHLLELAILVLELLEALRIRHLHPAILPTPPVESLLADVGVPADLLHRLLPVHLAQDPYDLFRRVPLSLHCLALG
jgi:hypothetical protein